MSKSLDDLPELVLHCICSYVASPFDLLCLGATCRHLRELTSSPVFWYKHVLYWCRGLWPSLRFIPESKHPKQWLLELLRHYTKEEPSTKTQCVFQDGEEWVRKESLQFRCLLGMLRCAYADRDENHHPAVLYRRWLYDIALFNRKNARINFNQRENSLPPHVMYELASLGQAAERDLRARKRPNINPIYYIKQICVAYKDWSNELFPASPSGSICPLLMCPSEAGYLAELCGTAGLLMCTSTVLAGQLISECMKGKMTLFEMTNIIQSACKSLRAIINTMLPEHQQRWRSQWLKNRVIETTDDEDSSFTKWQKELDKLNAGLCQKTIMSKVSELLGDQSLDAFADSIRRKWRTSLIPEISNMLEDSKESSTVVTRVNITDCDLIGGDNRRQEMAAAAFISDIGALVVWQLVGRERY